MKSSLVKISLIASAVFAAATALAHPFGTNITISDNNYAGKDWYSNREDQETETNPNTITSQAWDMEGMFLKGSELTLVGGYDFKNGVVYGGHRYRTGDIFIDIDGDAKYGPLNAASGATHYGTGPHTANTANAFGYDYVLDLNFTTMTYNVLALTSSSIVTRVMDVATSNPWTYYSGGAIVAGYQNIAFTYTAGLSNDDTGFLGDTVNNTKWSTHTNNNHYALSVDLGFLLGKNATVHYTMECGNDNLMGRAHVPDTGATVLLFGLGLVGLVGFRRKLGA